MQLMKFVRMNSDGITL